MGSITPVNKVRVAVLGCGFMGTALLAGILNSSEPAHSPVSKYTACVQTEASVERVRAALKSYTGQVDFVYNDNVTAAKEAQVVILGFQPNRLHQVLSTPGMSKALSGKLIISVLAGKSCQDIADELGPSQPEGNSTDVARVIPSIGAQINESMSLVAETPMSPANKELVSWLFNQVGKVEYVPEDLLNTATAVSATCHGLAATALDAIVDASVADGIPRAAAKRIAAQCLRSSASLLLEEGATIEAFKESMSVPYGITINAILQLDRGHVRPAISDAVRSAIKYANQMG